MDCRSRSLSKESAINYPEVLDGERREDAMTDPMIIQKAETVEERLKPFLWGDCGSGKTTIALQFPKSDVIDIKGWIDLCGHWFDHNGQRRGERPSS
jgi:hypothetical protein